MKQQGYRPAVDVVFDLGGVLIDWDPRYLFRDHLSEDPEAVERFLASVCTPPWHTRLDGGARFDVEAGALAERFPEYARWIEHYARDWERMFAGDLPETVACFERLLAEGYRLHALSNYPAERIAFLYRKYPFMRSFHSVVLSGLVGVTKPDERLYRYLIDRLGGRRFVFVDDREENVAAARGCGIDALLFDREAGVRRLLAALDGNSAGAVR